MTLARALRGTLGRFQSRGSAARTAVFRCKSSTAISGSGRRPKRHLRCSSSWRPQCTRSCRAG